MRGGLQLLEGYRAALGASDLRATASEIGVELARLGLRVALDGADDDSVLVWAEQLRASALRFAPVTPAKDPRLRDYQSELRRIGTQIRRAERFGRYAQSLLSRQAELEASIRRLARHAPGDHPASAIRPGRRSIARALGPAALVELIELDGQITALTLVDDRLRRHEIGPSGPVVEELEWLTFALGRLARPRQSVTQRAAALAGSLASAEVLGKRLFAPLAEAVGNRSVVIAPTGLLHAMPWAMLPPLRGRPVVVTPSVVTWQSLQSRPRRHPGKIVLAAGPGLSHAAREVACTRAASTRTPPG